MNRLAIILPFYKRPEITKICFENLQRQSVKYGVDVFASGDDMSIVPNELNFIGFNNNPLSNKINNLIQYTKAYDGVIILGSDDFISDSVIELYLNIDTTKQVFYGFDNIHTYSVWDNKLGKDLSYTKTHNTIGVARLWTKPTLQNMKYKIYSDGLNKGLDNNSKQNMLSNGIKEIAIPYEGHFILDVKHELNITSPNIINTCETFESVNLIKQEFGKVGEKILNLKKGIREQITKPKLEVMSNKIEVKYLVDASGIAKDTIKKLPIHLAKELVKMGVVELVVKEEVKPKVKQTRAKRK